MPKVNVYLPDALAESVRRLQIPLSSICQDALELEVVKREAVATEGGHLVYRGVLPPHRCKPPAVETTVRPWKANGTPVGPGAKWRCAVCGLFKVLEPSGTWTMDLSPIGELIVELFRSR